MYVTICMRLYMADRFLENRGVGDNMYETLYTTQTSAPLAMECHVLSAIKIQEKS